MTLLDPLLEDSRLRHVQAVDGSAGATAAWPEWADPEVVAAFARIGIERPWTHQAEAAELARAGQDVVLATGTASGKSLSYLVPALTAVREGLSAPNGRGATVLYLSPTKALAHDQLRAVEALAIPGVRAQVVDGDAPEADRAWARQHANLVLSNPDLLHFSMLPGHRSWAPLLRRLQLVVIDECHVYRGVFGSHVSAVLRRLLRIADHYGASPVVVACSATAADPAAHLARLVGRPARAVEHDASARPGRTIAFWQPDEGSANAQAAALLAQFVDAGAQALAFTRSRRGAETVASIVREQLVGSHQVAAYRGGYLPEERRSLEAALRSGELRALATTSALELGVDVPGVDAVITAGWPGTRASLWQQFGRAGRSGREAVAVFVARDDPLDSFLVRHPESVLGEPVEAMVCNPENRYVLAPHLCAAAAEIPLTDEEARRWFGASAPERLVELGEQGLLRQRPTGWFWTRPERAADLADLRGTGGAPIQVVEVDTGRLLGTVDRSASHTTVHEGAVYVHQGDSSIVRSLDLDDGIALVEAAEVDYYTIAQDVSDVRIIEEQRSVDWGSGRLCLGEVDVHSQVVSFQRRRLRTNGLLGQEPLDLPSRELRTAGVWWTLDPEAVAATGIEAADVLGAAHAAEHAAIGLLPIFATCDRWDIGGLSTAGHPDTGMLTVIVHDGFPGGAGFAEHGFAVAREWLSATLQVLRECPCEEGCPSCVQSPKCGNGNEPLYKDGAVRLLAQLLSGAPALDSASTSA